MASVYGLDELMWDLTLLGDKIVTMKAWEETFHKYDQMAAINPVAAKVQTAFDWLASQFSEEKAKILGSGQLAQLGDLPDRLSAIVGIPFQPFVGTATGLSPLNFKFTDMTGDPGQILTRLIGQWEGSAAEAFEDYFAAYERSQARQAELFAYLINGCASVGEVLVQCHHSVKELVRVASAVADEINGGYEKELRRRTEAAAAAFAIIATTVITAGVATGAAAVATFAAGTISLTQNVLSAEMAQRDFIAIDSVSLIDSLSDHTMKIESVLQAMDDELCGAVEAILAEWPITASTIPAPPGSDEIDESTFYHESA